MKITPHSNPEFFVVSSPRQQMHEYIRFNIRPLSHRRYEDGCWIVHLSHLIAVVALGEKYGFVDYSALPDELQLNLVMGKSKTVIKSEYSPFAVMHLLPTAPSAIVDAVYRALAKIHHPDVGGDEETFKTIVEAYDRIKQSAERDTTKG
jgi:hypothetical protein